MAKVMIMIILNGNKMAIVKCNYLTIAITK